VRWPGRVGDEMRLRFDQVVRSDGGKTAPFHPAVDESEEAYDSGSFVVAGREETVGRLVGAISNLCNIFTLIVEAVIVFN